MYRLFPQVQIRINHVKACPDKKVETSEAKPRPLIGKRKLTINKVTYNVFFISAQVVKAIKQIEKNSYSYWHKIKYRPYLFRDVTRHRHQDKDFQPARSTVKFLNQNRVKEIKRTTVIA